LRPPFPSTLLGRLLGLVASLGVFGLVATAQASPTFPGAIIDHLTATGASPACPPTCLLCHTSAAGGVVTVRDMGFTQNLRDQSSVAYNMRGKTPPRPLTQRDDSTVGPALDALEKLDCASMPGAVCDSDGDGVPDVAELRAGTNPDGPGGLVDCPQYGCGAKIAPSPRAPREVDGALLFAAVGLLVVARRVRR